MEEKRKINLGMIISIISIIIVIVLLGLLFNSKKELKDLGNKIDELNGTNKKAITAEKFKNIITTKGFNVNPLEDAFTEEVIKTEGLKNGYLTRNIEDEKYRINFYEYEDENSEEYWFYEGVIATRKDGNWNMTETTEKSMNHTKYTALTDSNYFVISRIGNTLVWGTIDANKKQELINIIDELGY